MSKVNIPSLMNEPPISVYPSLAKALGDVNKAIIVQQLHFLLSITRGSRNQYNYVDGYWWVYNTYEEWHAIFSWVSIRTLKTLFKSLEESGIVKSISGVKNKLDRRKWYRLDYEKLAEVTLPIVQKLHNEHGAEIAQWNGQTLHDVNRNTENTSENTTEKKPDEIKPRKILSSKKKRNPNLKRWDKVAAIGNELLRVFKNDFVPVEHQTFAALEPYLIVAEDLTAIGAPIEHIEPLYKYVAARAERENWNGFTVKALSKYYTDFLKGWNKKKAAAARPAPAPEPEITEAQRAELLEAVRMIRPDWEALKAS